MPGLIIDLVVPGGIAEDLGIVAGDRLISVNGEPIRDIIDYNYHIDSAELVLLVEKLDGEVWEVDLEKEEGESLGVIFPPPVPRQCGNQCVFCFVHQLPQGLRAPLYVKDEDYRLSFLYGNYVTLTNVTSDDLSRIKTQRLSPLYISIHATSAAVREQLLGRKGLPPLLPLLEELASARITMHTQVVLCPGLNDGKELERTVADLTGFHPWVASLSVVPVGLTDHRHRLPGLVGVNEKYAAEFVAQWQPRAAELADRLEAPFLFLADEFYLKAKLPFPPLHIYGDFPQLENGVGMLPLFMAEAEQVLAEAVTMAPATYTVVTGISPHRYLAGFLDALSVRTGVTFQTVAVENRLFGENITVTGLVAGKDIIAGLRDVRLGDRILIPDVMLKEGEGVFLDDVTIEELEMALKREVIVVPSTPHGLYSALYADVSVANRPNPRCLMPER